MHFPSCHILIELIVSTFKARFLTPKPHSHVSWVSMVTFIMIFIHCLVPRVPSRNLQASGGKGVSPVVAILFKVPASAQSVCS